MIDSLLATIQLIQEFFLDGFIALMAVAIAAPVLGMHLVLRRIPLTGLAVPQMGAAGQAIAVALMAGVVTAESEGHDTASMASQNFGAALGVFLGLVLLGLVTRDRRFSDVNAGIVFLVAGALRELVLARNPLLSDLDESMHHGQILTVVSEGRDQVVMVSAIVVTAAILYRRPLWCSAFDPDQVVLNGQSPRAWFLATLCLLGLLSGGCVPVIGPGVVLAFLLVPPLILRTSTPSIAIYPLLCAIAGIIGAAGAFLLSCAESVDLPPDPTLVICLVISSGFLAGLLRLGKLLTGGRPVNSRGGRTTRGRRRASQG